MANMQHWLGKGPKVMKHVRKSPMTLQWMSYLAAKTDQEWFDLLNHRTATSVKATFNHADHPPSPQELSRCEWDGRYSGSYGITLYDKKLEEWAIQTGAVMLQTLQDRMEEHGQQVRSMERNRNAKKENSSLTYQFWLRGQVVVTFFTLAPIPINSLLPREEQEILHVLCRLEEAFFAFWLNSWGGTRSQIPALRRISLEIWEEIYPEFEPESVGPTGCTSHTPLKETLFQNGHESITNDMRLRYALELETEAKANGTLLDEEALAGIWREADIVARAHRKAQNLENTKKVYQHRRDAKSTAQKIAFAKARRGPRRKAYAKMDPELKAVVNAERSRKAKAERNRVAALTPEQRTSERESKAAQKKPRTAAQLVADANRRRPKKKDSTRSSSPVHEAALPSQEDEDATPVDVAAPRFVTPIILSVREVKSLLAQKRTRTFAEKAYDQRRSKQTVLLHEPPNPGNDTPPRNATGTVAVVDQRLSKEAANGTLPARGRNAFIGLQSQVVGPATDSEIDEPAPPRSKRLLTRASSRRSHIEHKKPPKEVVNGTLPARASGGQQDPIDIVSDLEVAAPAFKRPRRLLTRRRRQEDIKAVDDNDESSETGTESGSGATSESLDGFVVDDDVFD